MARQCCVAQVDAWHFAKSVPTWRDPLKHLRLPECLPQSPNSSTGCGWVANAFVSCGIEAEMQAKRGRHLQRGRCPCWLTILHGKARTETSAAGLEP
eukprot:7906408-Alexandrium_andersonii.AAC.1